MRATTSLSSTSALRIPILFLSLSLSLSLGIQLIRRTGLFALFTRVADTMMVASPFDFSNSRMNFEIFPPCSIRLINLGEKRREIVRSDQRISWLENGFLRVFNPDSYGLTVFRNRIKERSKHWLHFFFFFLL